MSEADILSGTVPANALDVIVSLTRELAKWREEAGMVQQRYNYQSASVKETEAALDACRAENQQFDAALKLAKLYIERLRAARDSYRAGSQKHMKEVASLRAQLAEAEGLLSTLNPSDIPQMKREWAAMAQTQEKP